MQRIEQDAKPVGDSHGPSANEVMKAHRGVIAAIRRQRTDHKMRSTDRLQGAVLTLKTRLSPGLAMRHERCTQSWKYGSAAAGIVPRRRNAVKIGMKASSSSPVPQTDAVRNDK